jgi:hypothetical protein
MWWADRLPETYTGYTPREMHDMLEPPSNDPNPWFHAQSKDFQARVKVILDDLADIQRKWENVLWKLTPGTEEFRRAKLQMSTERWAYINAHPEYYDFYAFSKTPDQWAKTMDDWATDDLVDTYFNMEAPKRDKYKSAELWQKAVLEWKKSRELYLAKFPQVAERIATSRSAIETIWKQTEQHWFDILDRIGTRSVAIEAAKASKNFDLSDQLYLANDLDWRQLNEDVAVQYFDPTTDFVPLGRDANGKELAGPPILRADPFGHTLLKRTKLLPDFNRWRYDRADLAGKAVIERDTRYAEEMGALVEQAKGAKNFGAAFVTALKANAWLREEYFRRNPGKREQWATNDEYIRLIRRYGLLAKAGKFDEAGAYFDNLPKWVQDKYFNAHPEKRARRAKMQQNLQYAGYMKRWTDFYRRRDYSGGAAFFGKLPKWVQDRFYSDHPEGTFSGTSAYSKAMGKWVALLQSGDKDAAKKYFDALPQAYRERYYSKHPEAELRDNIKRTGQLGEYFAADDANRAQYLKDNPDFAKWLRAQGDSAATRRMMILAAYKALPTDDQWLRRVFREKYPEVFSKEATGAAAVKKVTAFLAEHPEMTPAFQKWYEAIMESYAEELKHAKAPPKPLEVIHRGRHDMTGFQPQHRGRSAEWVRLHSV